MASTSSQNQIDAVTIQVQQWVDNAIKNLLPQMHGLSILTKESALSRTWNITEFQDTIHSINKNFDIALQAQDTALSVTNTRSSIIVLLMSLASWYDSIPFYFCIFSISALMLTYYYAWNQHNAPRDHTCPQHSIFVKSLLLVMPLFGNI